LAARKSAHKNVNLSFMILILLNNDALDSNT